MHLGHANLVVERRVGCTKAVVQDVRDQCADGLVAGSRRQGCDELGQIGLAPGVSHGANMQGGSNYRKGLVASQFEVLGSADAELTT